MPDVPEDEMDDFIVEAKLLVAGGVTTAVPVPGQVPAAGKASTSKAAVKKQPATPLKTRASGSMPSAPRKGKQVPRNVTPLPSVQYPRRLS